MNEFHLSKDKYLILIIDDVESNIKLLTHLLRLNNYDVIAAFNGNDGAKIASLRKPDLILLDVLMPDMTGFELCKQLKEDEELASIPVIFISALTDVKDKIDGFEAGGVDFITKPFQQDEVLARIRTHLTLTQLLKERDARIRLLKKQEEEILRLFEKKEELIRIVSHDLYNPINGILGLSTLLSEDPSSMDSESKTMIEVIQGSSRKMVELVDKILYKDEQFKHVDSLNVSPTDLRELIDEVISLNRPKAVLKSIFLSANIEDDLPLVLIDALKIEIALNNLVSNALKFTQSKGEVTISVVLKAGEIMILVQDNGIGIPDNIRDSLFLESSENSEIGTSGEIGTGLGLDVVQNYINLHGGTITVKSEEKKGTEFTITLPLKK